MPPWILPRVRAVAARNVLLRSVLMSALVGFSTVSIVSVATPSWAAPTPPPFYAIKDARVVTGAGQTLERATVLVADGLIEAVGTDLAIPGDAWVIDGTGLTLYPGLIDGLTDLGLVASSDEGRGAGGGGGPGAGQGASGPPPSQGPQDRPQTTPWVRAADELSEDGRIESWREAGFTAVVTVPYDGFFPGQASVIELGDGENPDQRVVAASVAQRLGLTPLRGFRAYPSSLMGAFAYVEQVFLDTRQYATAQDSYRRDPRGRERPEYDRTLEPLAQALAAGTPFLVSADLPRHIDRALHLSRTEEFQPILVGVQGAYDRVDQLKAANVPVIVELNWPEAAKDRDPEADTPFRTLVHRRMAPMTPRLLAEAGVPFAFSSRGVGTPSEIFAKLRKAVDEGLSDDAALAALTSAPAEIFGVADRLGTIETGKIANLVLATAAPWVEDVEIRAVFVDGRKYETPREDEAKEPPTQDVSGTWTLNLQTPRGAREVKAELTMAEDGKVTGETTSEMGTNPIQKGRMSGDLLRFEISRTMGGRQVTSSYSLSIEGEKLSGSISAGPMNFDVSGDRTAKPEAKPKTTEAEAADEVTVAELNEGLRLYQGPVERPGTFAIRNVTVFTLSGDTIEDGIVVVQDGKIAAVGQGVAIPAGAEVIDGQGGSLIPGIIDAHSHIAIEGGVNEGSISVTAMVSVADVLDADDIDIYRALAGGVTSANILHGSANPIGGQNAVIKLRWGADAEGLKLAGAPPGIKFALGENPKRSNFRSPNGAQRYPQTRMGVMDVIRQAFTDARAYRDEWQRYETARAAFTGRGKKAEGAPPLPPRHDLALDALVEILEGKRLVHSHCYRADEILQLLRLAEEQGFRIATLQHVLEGYKVADEIAAHGAGASTFSDWWGYKVEAYDAIPYNAALMTERGVLVSINSDSAEEMRHLNQEAAKAVKWGGMDRLEALRMVTLNPAKQLGIDRWVGSIEVGKDADLVLYDGDPLSVRSVVQKTFVDGILYFDREADRERTAAIEALEARLDPDDKKDEAEKGGAGDDEAAADEGAEAEPEPDLWNGSHYSCREEEGR